MPIPPSVPDYDEVIADELARIGDFSWIKDKKERKKREKESTPFRNLGYNDAEVEAFEATILSKLKSLYEDYDMELDQYKIDLERYNSELAKNITQLDTQQMK
jgi:hypothetical protein